MYCFHNVIVFWFVTMNIFDSPIQFCFSFFVAFLNDKFSVGCMNSLSAFFTRWFVSCELFPKVSLPNNVLNCWKDIFSSFYTVTLTIRCCGCTIRFSVQICSEAGLNETTDTALCPEQTFPKMHYHCKQLPTSVEIDTLPAADLLPQRSPVFKVH